MDKHIIMLNRQLEIAPYNEMNIVQCSSGYYLLHKGTQTRGKHGCTA
jgi:hypothetical protein